MEIRILFEDEQIIVCEKPAGVAVQTKRLGQADMESLLKNRRAGKGELPYIGVVHRQRSAKRLHTHRQKHC